jgi:hypothetical protein
MKIPTIILIFVVANWTFDARADSVPAKKESAAPLQTGERLIESRPRDSIDWSATDLAMREAMNSDPNYAAEATRDRAIAAWKRYLERDDLTNEQQGFALWRLGALYAYNFDPSRGETADFDQAETTIVKARALFSNLVTVESLNSATVYGGLPGVPIDRARRLTEAFKWLNARNQGDIDRSAERVNHLGSILDKKFFPQILHRSSTLAERKQFLSERLAEYRDSIARRIEEEIRYSNDPAATTHLLKSLESVADPRALENWHVLKRERDDNTAQLKQPSLESSRHLSRAIFVSLNGLLVVVLAIVYLVKRRVARPSK